jgi:adenine/guanine phosphoribosyltransferase-like PRPP-binding protein
VHKRIKGSYAVIALIAGHGLLAFRDPYGIRPLATAWAEGDGGRSDGGQRDPWRWKAPATTVRDVAPGEALFIDLQGKVHAQQCADAPQLHPCMFEYVYLARPDSVMDGISVYQARLNLGETLAQRVINTMPPSEIDVVIPIPESSRPSAMQLAQKIGKPYREGFVKNRYVGRTFIMPGQQVRKKSVRQKLNAIGVEFKGRNVLLVDDSIVRGTTSKEIVQMAREAGARKVYMASRPRRRCAIPTCTASTCPRREELVAHNRTLEEIRQFIGADALIYQDVDAMKRVVGAEPGHCRLRGQLLRRRIHHRRCQRGRLRPPSKPSACRPPGRRRQTPAPAWRCKPRQAPEHEPFNMSDHDPEAARIARAGHPGRPETLAVRTAMAPSQHGENSEALYLSSRLCSPIPSHRGRRFANEEGFTYGRTSNPTSPASKAPGGDGRRRGGHRHVHRHGAILLLVMGLLKAGDHVVCSRSCSAPPSAAGQGVRKFGVETTFVSQTDLARVACGDEAQHQAAVRRDTHQPADRGVRHRGAGRHRARRMARCWRWTTASARRRCSGRWPWAPIW